MIVMVDESREIEEMIKQVDPIVEAERKKFDPESNNTNALSAMVLKALEDNEVGDGRLFKEHYRDKFCYDHSEGQWYRFNGNFWEEDIVNEAFAAVDKVVELYEQEVQRQVKIRIKAVKSKNTAKAQNAEAKEKELLNRMKFLQTENRSMHVLAFAAAGLDGLGRDGSKWDADPMVLGCKNGVIDLKTGMLREGQPDDYIRTASPTEWQGIDTPAPLWREFLLEVFDKDQDTVDFLQRVLGYAITGKATEHILPILCGHGRNGKGTLLETIGHVLGALAGPLQSEMLLEQSFSRSSNSPSPDIMSLQGLRVAWASETNDGRSLNSGKVKWLVGGDTLVGRRPHAKKEVKFKPSHTLFLLTNHKPHAQADDYALWHRIYLIQFKLSFVDKPKKKFEKQRAPDLQEKLMKEAPGILSWLVQGSLKWQKQGLCPPAAIEKATAEYRSEEDILGHFIEDCCESDQSAKIQHKELYEAYKKWCIDAGHRQMSRKKFGFQMGERFEKEKRRYVNYVGVKLSDPPLASF